MSEHPTDAQRLDSLLGKLVESRSAASRDHGSHRRRQRARVLLAATAAAVVVAVAGVGLPRLGAAGDPANDSAAGAVVAAPDFAGGDVARLDADTLAADVAAALAPADPAYSSNLTLTGLTCEPAAYGAGRLVPVLLDGTPAVLAIRPPDGGVRTAQVLACGTADVRRP